MFTSPPNDEWVVKPRAVLALLWRALLCTVTYEGVLYTPVPGRDTPSLLTIAGAQGHPVGDGTQVPTHARTNRHTCRKLTSDEHTTNQGKYRPP